MAHWKLENNGDVESMIDGLTHTVNYLLDKVDGKEQAHKEISNRLTELEHAHPPTRLVRVEKACMEQATRITELARENKRLRGLLDADDSQLEQAMEAGLRASKTINEAEIEAMAEQEAEDLISIIDAIPMQDITITKNDGCWNVNVWSDTDGQIDCSSGDKPTLREALEAIALEEQEAESRIIPKNSVTDEQIIAMVCAFYRNQNLNFYADDDAWEKMPDEVKEAFTREEA